MTFINPLANVLPAAAVAQQQQADDKTRQLRRAQAAENSIGADDDGLVHQVEGSEGLSPVDPENRGRQHPGSRQHPHRKSDDEGDADAEAHIDITA